MSGAFRSSFVWTYKGRISASLTLAVPLSYYAYDRYESKRIRDTFVSLAQKYGEAPMPTDQLPIRITFLAEGIDRDFLAGQKELFMKYVQPILTAAGVDFDWSEASVRKHCIQLKEALKKEQNIGNLPPGLDDNSSELFFSRYFTDVLQWRMTEWLNKDFDGNNIAVEEKKSLFGGVSRMFGGLCSWMWPVKLSPGDPEKTPTTTPQETATPNLADEQRCRENASLVKKNLLPSSPGIHGHQQGIIILDEDCFRNVLDSYRHVRAARIKDWERAFETFPVRVGYLPLFRRSSVLSSIKNFFSHRRVASSYGSLAFGMVTDHYLLLDSLTEQALLPFHSSPGTLEEGDKSAQPENLAGHILILHPTSVPGLEPLF